MTSTEPPNRKRRPMEAHRKTSLSAGVLYLITFASIPTLFLYEGVKTDAAYIAGAGPDTAVVFGGLLEVIVALACIGTGVALYPMVKRQNEGVALGFVGARILEAAAISAGVVALMSIVSLRQTGVGDEALVTGQALLAQHIWTTLLGQGLIPAFNALLLGSLMYRSRLLPRALPIFGFIGAPLLSGADRVIDYTEEDFTRTTEQYDVVMDCVGNVAFNQLQTAIKPGGALLSVITDLHGAITAGRRSRRTGKHVIAGNVPFVAADLAHVARLSEAG
ncbi:DUF4386 family protein [Arthrobacter sp. D2-10]